MRVFRQSLAAVAFVVVNTGSAAPPAAPPFATPESIGPVTRKVPVQVSPNLDLEGVSLKGGRSVRFSLLLQVTNPGDLLPAEAAQGAQCQFQAEGATSPSTSRIAIQPEWLSCYDSRGNTLADVAVKGYLMGVDNALGLPSTKDVRAGTPGLAVIAGPIVTGQKGTARIVGD